MGLHSLNYRSLEVCVCPCVRRCVCVCMCARGRRCCGRGVSLDGVTLLSPFRLVADTIERHRDSIGADSIPVLLRSSGHRPSVGLSSHAGAEMGLVENATEA